MSNPAFKFDHVHIISENPKASAAWYVEMLGATIAADTIARGAPQIFVELGNLTALCADLRKKGVSFPVELKKGVGGSLLCYVAAPDGVSIERMQC